MNYVDGFLLPVPTKNLAAYKKMARTACKVWMDHGALEYRECLADDIKIKGFVPFDRAVKTKRGETVVIAWIVYKSKAHRDKVNAKAMKDPRLNKMMDEPMPFDCKRMSYGGFQTLVSS